MEIDIMAGYVRLASYFVATTLRKPEYGPLFGVRVEPHEDGAVIVASDGACMFIAIDETGYVSEPVNLNVGFSLAEASLGKTFKERRLVGDDDSLRIKAKRETIDQWDDEFLLNDQSYLNWRSAVPKPSHVLMSPVAFAKGYLTKIAKLADDVPDLDVAAFYGHNQQTAAIIRFPKMPSIMMLLMPYSTGPDYPLGLDRATLDRFTLPAPKADDGEL